MISQSLIQSDLNLKDVLNLFGKQLSMSINCHVIGTVKSFNSTKQTVECTINYQRNYLKYVDGSYVPQLISYPVLVDCPVVILGGGGTHLTFPIAAGDECLILFNDRDMDLWFKGQNNRGNNTPRLHSFADGIVLVGLQSLNHSIVAYDTDRVQLRDATGEIAVSISDADIEIKSTDASSVLVESDAITSTSTTVTMTDLIAKVETGTGRVEISNLLFNLKDLLLELISDVNSLVSQTAAITVTGVSAGTGTSGIPSNASNISNISGNLNATGVKIAGLLK